MGTGITGRMPEGPLARAYDQQQLAKGVNLDYRANEKPSLCWLCPATEGKATREHVFPRWLQRHLNAENQLFEPTHLQPDRQRVLSQRGPMPAKAFVGGEVCASCNNGWMSRLENDFRDLVFADTRPGRLQRRAQARLAQWFVKTAVVLNSSQNYRALIPADVRHAVATAAPRSFEVYLARTSDVERPLGFWQGVPIMAKVPDGFPKHLIDERAARASFVVLQVGSLVAASIYAPPNQWLKPASAMQRIHPIQVSEISLDALPEIPSAWDMSAEGTLTR